ncbi:MAG: YdcF family protein [Desulfobacterales bacterium]|nr:MAG: YdcF family protein [Desulfobacterales bacterium]
MALFSSEALHKIGAVIVIDEKPVSSDAVVVLNTGLEYHPRLVQAAELYRQGLVRRVVINGNRKTDSLRELEAQGFKPCCPWYADSLSILSMLGVPEDKVISISAEDVYDTVGEAEAVGNELVQRHLKSIIITTSKFHTRRARCIWKQKYNNEFDICTVAAETDPYDPNNWWKDGRQVRWVLAEYGAWIYYWWKTKVGD